METVIITFLLNFFTLHILLGDVAFFGIICYNVLRIEGEKMQQKSMIKKSFLFFLAVFCFLKVSNAQTGTINGDKVNFRSGAGVNYSILGQLNKGNVVEVKSAYAVNGSGCNSGWINILYQGKNGYVCRSYINIQGMETYHRPWSSPKKAIMGGAEFIASSYISKGQYNSYLKKFNVNPASASGVYEHQYMSNLAAPMNEAKTTYNSYKQNGLLSLPLEFTIPIFNNMPEYTTHPVTGREIGGTSVVSDPNFEASLDAQGFDETYKKWLRELHKSYPNWTFKSLKTGLDFNKSVEAEKWIGAINGSSCPKCKDPLNINTEGSWYIPSTQTTEYFLDPRNCLMVDSILMFENLAFSDNYKESTVQSVLNGTFMSGKDAVDQLSYASIFMDAGKTFNVNPIYLASLSRQEVGTNGSISTSGERIEYQGNVYQGFYNFYNIGANSSEASPVRAGIVYASAGASKNAEGVFVGNSSSSSVDGNGGSNGNNEKPTTPSVTPLATHLSNMKLNRKGDYVTNISLGTTVGMLKSRTKGSELHFRNASGGTLGDSEKVSTGAKITFPTGETLTVVVYGDLTGDANINSADLLRMRQHLLGQSKLGGSFLEAARLINTSGNVNSADLLRLRQYLLGQKSISQA